MKMKNILMTSYTLITLSLLIVITALLCNQWSYSYMPCDNLSAHYKDYVITSTENQSMLEFVSCLNSEYTQFRLQKQTGKDYAGVYLKNCDMKLELVEGREFCKDDFEKNKDVVMISERCLKNTYKEGNKRYIVIEKNVYEVIGVFSQKENPINENTDIFINMLSEQFANTTHEIAGKYYFDCEQELNNQIQDKYEIKENDTIYDMGILKHLKLVKDTMFISWNVVLCGIIFLILSLLFLFIIWLMGEKEIILANYICGATRKQVFFLVLKKWMLINLAAIIVSMVLGASILVCNVYCLLFFILYIVYAFFSGMGIAFYVKRK